MFTILRCLYLAILFALFSLQGVSQESDSIDRSDYKLLWEISGNGLESKQFLFGTYHSNDPDVFNFPVELYEAILGAEAIVLEADITELMANDAYYDYSSLNFGKDIFDWVIPFSNRDKVTFTGYGSDNGRPQFIDLYFKQIADNCNKRFYPLEDLEDQLSIGLNNEIDTTVEGYIDTPSKEEMKKLYLEGRANKLHDFTKLSTRRYLNLYDELLVDRNHVMANGLDTLMQSQKVFCAVGAAHLMGPEGIVPLLKKKGYTVNPVNSTFTSEKSKAEKELDKCSGYFYSDQKFGAQIEFTGKPVITDQENGNRIVQYREMGQGNTYTLNMHHYEVITDLDETVMEYFTTEPQHISRFDSIQLDDKTIAYQARIDRGGNNVYWMRAFHRNDILYTLYCTGGYRFVNSDRPFKFFETFSFGPKNKGQFVTDTLVYSPSNTLRVKLPKGAETYQDATESDSYWYAKWFDPYAKKSVYVYENQITNNSLYLDDIDYGDYLIEEFGDSISFYDFNKSNDFSEKYFSALRMGRKVFGKMRLIGNVIHYAQYTGNDSIEARKFLSEVKFNPPREEATIDQKRISNASLSSYVTKHGFSPQSYDEKYLYRNTKHYLMNDPENVIIFQAYKKEFRDWAFSDKPTKQLLIDQVIWPKDTLKVSIDSTFDLNNEHPTMHYAIHYTESKNMLRGKIILKNRTIGTSNMIYPYAFDEKYKKLYFLDSIEFKTSSSADISSINLEKIKTELINGGNKGIAQLVENDHVNQQHLEDILLLHDSLFEQYDENAFLQYTLLYKLAEHENNTLDPVDLWNQRSRNASELLTEALLYYCAKQKNTLAFNQIASSANEKGISWNNKELLLDELKTEPAFLAEIWSAFEPSILDSLSWKISFHLAELSSYPFFREVFMKKDFVNAMLSSDQPEWAAFRYFEWIFKSDIDNRESFLDSLIGSWIVQENEQFRKGVKLGWQNVLQGKLDRKDRRWIENNIMGSIAYAKVMAVSGEPTYEVFDFEKIIGLISFDHYEDSFFDPNKTIELLEKFELKEHSFALFKCVENKKVYYLAQQLPENKVLPSYKDFGDGAYFFFFEDEPTLSEIKRALKGRLTE